jgi:hypothetical protein
VRLQPALNDRHLLVPEHPKPVRAACRLAQGELHQADHPPRNDAYAGKAPKTMTSYATAASPAMVNPHHGGSPPGVTINPLGRVAPERRFLDGLARDHP